MEFGGSGRLQKKKEVKKEKCKGMCVEEKKKRKKKKKRNAVCVWRIKKEGKKKSNGITIFLQYFHNKF